MGRLRAGRFGLGTVLAAALLMVGAPPAATGVRAQEAEDRTVSPDTTEEDAPEYRREVFEYPAGDRRNPFAPVDAGVQVGPRFENLTLTGILYSPGVGSVAVLVDRSTGERYRVRDGQRIGQARILEIRASEVVFSVEGARDTRREVLQLEKRREESQG